MKTKYRQVNKCIRCGDKAGNFVWTTSRQVNDGIRAMYPNGKLCQNCLKELQSVYPPNTMGNESTFKKGKICPVCGSDSWKSSVKNVTNDPVPDKSGDAFCNGRKWASPDTSKEYTREDYCSVCGYVEDVE